MGRALLWALAAAALCVFAAMVLWMAPRISAGAGGLLLFDERIGYSHAEAAAFLGALSDEARALYLGPMRALDTAFPVLLAAALGLAILRLTPGWPMPARLLALVAPLAGAAFDFMENASVAAMLRTPPEALTPEAVSAASFRTTAKWAADLAAGATVAGLILHRRVTSAFGGEKGA